MKINIEFKCDNDVFFQDFNQEVEQLLEQAYFKICKQLYRHPCLCKHLESIDKLLDTNGNTVGTVTLCAD